METELEEAELKRKKQREKILRENPNALFMSNIDTSGQRYMPITIAKNARLGTWKSRKEIMEQDNKNGDYYAITLFDNDGNLNHVLFEVQLQMKRPPRFPGDIAINYICKTDALLDTGATTCAITGRKAREIGLKPTGEEPITSSGGKRMAATYLLDVIFPQGKVFENIEATEISDDHNCDFLIGMNIISQGDMALTRVNGIAAFSFRVPPAGRYIEFEKEGRF